ncbi:cytochrome P450 [Fistulina hepatica ATCC 64428]|nr:cytochrome P450 [Fistulina hepatica ATCC 64428]
MLFVLVSVLGFASFYYLIYLSKFRRCLPPGPNGLPILCNTFDMPTSMEWITFRKWGEIYGDICSVKIPGQVFIILNSIEAAVDLLDKRSNIYSDRPTIPMGGEICGWKNSHAFHRYGTRQFRRSRRLFHEILGTRSAVAQWASAQEFETKRFLRNVLETPDKLSSHIRSAAGALILRISHGYVALDHDDPLVNLAEQAAVQFSVSTPPGYPVNMFPALIHIPEWVPGINFKSMARLWRSTLLDMVERPHKFVKEQMAEDKAMPSFTSNLLKQDHLTPDDEDDIKWTAQAMYAGGADTTVSTNYSFFLAMILFPEVQRKAHDEIDAIIGQDRLPCLEDRPNLPYINALVKEAFRWNSVAVRNVCGPHRVMEDDTYKGYDIPKGAIVLPNQWGMTHDPVVYKDPMQFNPQRFLGPNPELDPRQILFCPSGSLLAEDSVFMLISMSLCVLEISKAIVNGVEVLPVHENTSGTVSHPMPFECSVKARSKRAAALVMESSAEQPTSL